MRAYWPRGSKKVQPASVLPVSLKRGPRRFPRLATLMNPFSDSSTFFVQAEQKKNNNNRGLSKSMLKLALLISSQTGEFGYQ